MGNSKDVVYLHMYLGNNNNGEKQQLTVAYMQ